MRYCPNCGAEISRSDNFCTGCGERIELDERNTKSDSSKEDTTEMQARRGKANTRKSAVSSDSIEEIEAIPDDESILLKQKQSYFTRLLRIFLSLLSLIFAMVLLAVFGGEAGSLPGFLLLMLIILSVGILLTRNNEYVLTDRAVYSRVYSRSYIPKYISKFIPQSIQDYGIKEKIKQARYVDIEEVKEPISGRSLRKLTRDRVGQIEIKLSEYGWWKYFRQSGGDISITSVPNNTKILEVIEQQIDRSHRDEARGGELLRAEVMLRQTERWATVQFTRLGKRSSFQVLFLG